MNILIGYTQIQLQQNFQTGKEWNMPDISHHPWKYAWMTTPLRPQREPNNSIFKTKQLCSTHNILPDFTFSHAEFPPGMENTPVFPGNQFLRGKEKNMDTGTFTLGNIILNRYPALSTLTHQAIEPGRVQQNFQQLKMESSDMEALPCFDSNAEATQQMETSRKGLGADSTQNGKDTTVTSS